MPLQRVNIMSLNMFLLAISEGLMWGLMALGVYLTFRILNFADLTVEGSVVLGMAVALRLITAGFNPLMATLVAVIAGMAAGLITGFFHTVLKIPPLLSGILTMTGLWSINLRVIGTGALITVPPGSYDTLMSRSVLLGNFTTFIAELFGGNQAQITRRADILAMIVVGLIFVTIVIVLLKLFFNTEIGYAIRATGDNEPMVKAQGINTNLVKLFGLALGNGCVALAGALVAQAQRNMNIDMGVGAIVIGLAAVIIGEVFFRDKNNHRVFIAVVFGGILFFIIRAFVLNLGFININDFRLISALILGFVLALPMFRDKFSIQFKKLTTNAKRGG